PKDVNPGEGEVFFTVRDQIHRPRKELTPPAGVQDRILEGRQFSTVNNRAQVDAAGLPVGVDSSIYKSVFDASTSTKRTGVELGLIEANGVNPDDHVNDISFGNDAIRPLYQTGGGGELFFSVDTYAKGLSPHRAGHARTGVYAEATVVNEAAGDIFVSNFLLPGDNPLQNNNAKKKNTPNADFLKPAGNNFEHSTYADSYYLGLVGGRVADDEDDVTGLEGVGGKIVDPNYRENNGFYFFTLDRGSPSGHLGDILVAREDTPGQFRTFASAAQLGLGAADNIDGLCVEFLSDLDGNGWPVYDPSRDLILFSVDRDSRGLAGTPLRLESDQGEVAADIFFAASSPGNMLFLEGTDLGLQEFAMGAANNFLTDNLDAIDLPDIIIPEPSAAALVMLCALGMGSRRRR
ncbi:MAG: hypothetical protein ACREJC_09055, partial [Tepidisphaeraceae bacterium]